MHINKQLDYLGNINLLLDITSQLEGRLNANIQELSFMFDTPDSAIKDFVQTINDHIQIKINGEFVKIKHDLEKGTFTTNFLEEINQLEIYVDDKLLVEYQILENDFVLKQENLIDSYFIKNSILNNNINFNDIVETEYKIKTDLHTHYAGAPSAKGLIELGLKSDFKYPRTLLEKAGINILSKESTIPLRSLSKEDLKLLEKEMQISVGKQIRFSNEEENLEKIYSFRQPFFRDYNLTSDLLELIAKEYASNGVSYVELSGSQIFDLEKEPQMFKLATKEIPKLEKKYGVKLRFLGAMTRYDDVEWSLDQLEKLKLIANNPYISGIDVVGHETNSTLDIVNNIEPYMAFAKENGLDWTFRFHAGENPSHPENVKEALKLAEKHGVKIRIGHGLYGIDEETLELAKRTNAIIEINSSSNLALNNVTDIEDMQPLIFYLKNGINVVLGTDSPGIYQTNSQQELAVAKRLLNRHGLPNNLLEQINKVEDDLINNREKEEQRLFSIPESTTIPPPNKFIGLSEFWTPDVSIKKQATREFKISSQIEKINEIGSIYIEPNNIEAYLIKHKKIPFVISGASKSNWKQLTDAEKDKIQSEMLNLLNKLDSNKYIIVTGGTDYGVEEIIHNNAKQKGFSVIGVLTEEANISEIKNSNISHYTIAKGNWWAKSSFVMDNIIKPCNGKVLFVAGGSIVGDEILSSLYHKLDKSQLFLMSGVGGASDKKAKQNPQYAVDSATEIIENLDEEFKDKMKKYILTRIKQCRTPAKSNNQTNVRNGI